MGAAKIEFTLGGIAFSGEGEEAWLAEQLDKILVKAPELTKIVPELPTAGQSGPGGHEQVAMSSEDTISSQTLAVFLRANDAIKPAQKKFLATAVWLHAKGNTRLSTGDVTKALKDSSQSRLTNASDCLNRNVNKGYIEKDGNRQFFVTDEGRASLKR